MARPKLDPATSLIPLAMIAIGGLTVMRVLALVFDPNSLYADETQYWLWAQTLDWGYFSKPPMIAWVIASTTAVFGDADWAVRLAAPILHALTASFLGLTAARLFGARVGAWTAIGWMTLPSVWLSSAIISTDAVLLVGWSAGLYALARLRDGAGWPWALALGLSAGFAFLSKYAAIYFVLGSVLAVLVDAPARRALLSLKGLGAGLVFLALIAGNLAWNAANDFATVSHTAANANWGASLFNADELITFVGDQFGVFGPIFFPILIWALIQAFREWSWDFSGARPRLMLALYTAPPLLIVSIQAFISRAHANWAVSAYAAGLILVVALLLEGPRWRRIALLGSIALHSLVGLVMLVMAASPALSEAAGLANAFKRVREWPATVEALEEAAREAEVSAIVFDNRNDFHQMQRYGATPDDALFMWLRYAGPHNFAEAGWPLPDGYDQPVLIASERPRELPLMGWEFDRFEPAGEIVIPLGGGRERRYVLIEAQGYQRLPRDADFEARVQALRSAD